MKFKKRIFSLFTATVLTAVTLSFSASADEQSATIADAKVIASSEIRPCSAGSSTRFERGSGNVSVYATYSYVNIDTLVTGTYSRGDGGQLSCDVDFSVASNYRSIRISATHSATSGGQSWSTSTSEIR